MPGPQHTLEQEKSMTQTNEMSTAAFSGDSRERSTFASSAELARKV
jgi:hypothetical protein